jgi:proteasome accessory factor B
VHAGRAGDELELELRNLDTVARWLAGHGPDIAVLGPQPLIDRVRTSWEAAAEAHAAESSVGRPAASA